MIVALGNSPSSGSTFLADILDSLPSAVCGPEINLFSVRNFFSANFDAKQLKPSVSPVLYGTRQRLLTERLGAYGIEERLFRMLAEEADSFESLCQKIFQTFSDIRNKQCSLYFEKTPQNIHCARLFLDRFPEGYFLHIVRNPLYVYKSLLRRGFPEYLARNTWLIDVASAYRLREHPRFITVRYEDLVEGPYRLVVDTVKQFGCEISEEELKCCYENNRYRKAVSRKNQSWSINQYGAQGNANLKKVDDTDIAALKKMLATQVSPAYAQLFDLPEVAFADLSHYYGYEFRGLIGNVILDRDGSKERPDRSTFYLLAKKFYYSLLAGEANLASLSAYLSPVL